MDPASKYTALKLCDPLGQWTSASTTTQWGAMVWGSALYRSDPFVARGQAEFQRHIAMHYSPGGNVFYDTKPAWYTATIPTQAIPVDLTGTASFKASYATSAFASLRQPLKTFKAWVKALPPAERRLLSHTFWSTSSSEAALLQYLQTPCTLHVGTRNGSGFKPGCGALAWFLFGPDEKSLIRALSQVDTWHDCLSMYRSELAAIASLILFIDELAKFY